MPRVDDADRVPQNACDAIDWVHLGRATLDDPVLARDVLGLFLEQIDGFARDIEPVSDGTPMLVHSLKGTARALGAWPIADAALAVERQLAPRSDPSDAIAALRLRIATARDAITAHLGGDGGSAGAAHIDSV